MEVGTKKKFSLWTIIINEARRRVFTFLSPAFHKDRSLIKNLGQ